MAESGGGVEFLGRGSTQAPSPPARGLGNAVSSPSGVGGKAPGKCGFGAFRDLKNQVISTFHGCLVVFSFRSCAKIFSHFTIGGGSADRSGQVLEFNVA